MLVSHPCGWFIKCCLKGTELSAAKASLYTAHPIVFHSASKIGLCPQTKGIRKEHIQLSINFVKQLAPFG